jgi:hypothetical protein
VAGHRQRTVGHAVVAAAERHHAGPVGGDLGQLEGGLDRVGAAGSAELDAPVLGQVARQHGEQLLQEGVLGRRGQVERGERQLVAQSPLDRLDDHRVAVAERQRARPGEAVEVLVAAAVADENPASRNEVQGDSARIGARRGLIMGLARQGRIALEAFCRAFCKISTILLISTILRCRPGLVDRVGVAERSHVVGIPTTWQ